MRKMTNGCISRYARCWARGCVTANTGVFSIYNGFRADIGNSPINGTLISLALLIMHRLLPNSAQLTLGNLLSYRNSDEKMIKYSLDVPVHSTVLMNDSDYNSVSMIKYEINVHDDRDIPNNKLTLNSLTGIVDQDIVEVRQLLGSRVSGSFQSATFAYSAYKFDMRSLMYVIGFCVGRFVHNLDVKLCTKNAAEIYSAKFLGESCETGFMILPDLYEDPSEVYFLATLLPYAGVESMAVADDLVSNYNGTKIITRGKACSFLLRLSRAICAYADEKGVASEHYAAYGRGMNASVTLVAHSREGGFSRTLLQNAIYPVTTGTITASRDEFMGLSLRKNIVKSQQLRQFLCDFFTFARCVCASDPGSELESGRVIPHIVRSDAMTNADRISPINIGTLHASVEKWWKNVLTNTETAYKLNCGVSSTTSFMGTVFSHKTERHLFSNRGLAIFNWVESIGLDVIEGVNDVVYTPITDKQGRSGTLPLINGPIIRNGSYEEIQMFKKNVATAGSKLYATLNNTCAREQGFSYVFGPTTNIANSYAKTSHMRLIRDVANGFFHNSACFSNGESVVANARWTTPHNGMPSPLEWQILVPTLMVIPNGNPVVGGSLGDWRDGHVKIQVGNMRLGPPLQHIKVNDCHNVPALLEPVVSNMFGHEIMVVNGTEKKYMDDLPGREGNTFMFNAREPADATKVIISGASSEKDDDMTFVLKDTPESLSLKKQIRTQAGVKAHSEEVPSEFGSYVADTAIKYPVVDMGTYVADVNAISDYMDVSSLSDEVKRYHATRMYKCLDSAFICPELSTRLLLDKNPEDASEDEISSVRKLYHGIESLISMFESKKLPELKDETLFAPGKLFKQIDAIARDKKPFSDGMLSIANTCVDKSAFGTMPLDILVTAFALQPVHTTPSDIDRALLHLTNISDAPHDLVAKVLYNSVKMSSRKDRLGEFNESDTQHSLMRAIGACASRGHKLKDSSKMAPYDSDTNTMLLVELIKSCDDDSWGAVKASVNNI